MNITDIFNISSLTEGLPVLIVSIAVLVIIIVYRASLVSWLSKARQRLFTRAGLFWAVNLVFMAVSVLHAGAFFGITGNGHDIPGVGAYLGFAVSFFLDLVTIILMQAQLEARYRGEAMRARQFLAFIVVCCGTSTFANLAISLNDFNAVAMLPHAPFWVQVAAPYVLASFPLFVIMMSIAAEMVVNVRPLESLNEEEYEADEKKRLRILEIRNTYLEKQANEELRAINIRLQMRANKALQRGSNRFHWPLQKTVDFDTLTTQITEKIKADFDAQIEALKTQITAPQNQAQNSQNTEPLKTLNADAFNDSRAVEGATNSQENSAENEEGKAMPINDTEGSAGGVSPDLSPTIIEVITKYPMVRHKWLIPGSKTATIEEITEVTGHTKRRLNKAPLRRSSRNPELILISSVMEWLKITPPPTPPEHLKLLEKEGTTDN